MSKCFDELGNSLRQLRRVPYVEFRMKHYTDRSSLGALNSISGDIYAGTAELQLESSLFNYDIFHCHANLDHQISATYTVSNDQGSNKVTG